MRVIVETGDLDAEVILLDRSNPAGADMNTVIVSAGASEEFDIGDRLMISVREMSAEEMSYTAPDDEEQE